MFIRHIPKIIINISFRFVVYLYMGFHKHLACHVGHIGFSTIHAAYAIELGNFSANDTLIIYDTDKINQSDLAHIKDNLEITIEPRPIYLTHFPEPKEINMLFELHEPNIYNDVLVVL